MTDIKITEEKTEKKFFKGITKTDGDCHLHNGTNNGHGYAMFYYLTGQYAHRYAWERINGKIPYGMTIDHLCENKRCVNINHLEMVTGAENTRRYSERRTICKNGLHPKYGIGSCKECAKVTGQRGAKRRTNTARGISDARCVVDPEVKLNASHSVISGVITVKAGAELAGITREVFRRYVWHIARQAIQERDKGICRRCDGVGTDIHHMLPRKAGGTSDAAIAYGPDNLVTLCRPCHTWIESNRTQAMAEGWLRASS